MRISADLNDPSYSAENVLFRVMLNGAQLQHVITADEERGWLLRYVTDENGQVRVQDGQALTEERRGTVVLQRMQ